MKYTIIVISLLLLIINSYRAHAIIDYNDNCKKSFESTIALDHKRTNTLLEIEIKRNPTNSVINYIRTYESFLNYVTNGDDDSFNSFEKNRELCVNQLNNETDNNPYKLYLLADIYLQESIINSLQSNYFSAIYLVKKSYNTINDNIDNFPDFVPNNKIKGLAQISIGSLPRKYNWAFSILGIYGDVDKGFVNLKKSLLFTKNNKEYNFLFVENLLVYTFLSDNFSNQNIKDDILNNIFNDTVYNKLYANNLFYIFVQASFFQHHKENSKTIKALAIVKNNPNRVTNDFCYLNYLYGLSLLYDLNDGSELFFQKYIDYYPANNYKASSHQKIGWSKLIRGDLRGYLQEKTTINQIAPGFYDSDDQALKEAKSNEVPNTYLLKARLLFDGGYYQRATKAIMEGKQLNSYKSERSSIEYIYRLGRINDENGNYDIAEKYYLQTIEKAKDLNYFFAAKSALQLGYRYEITGQKVKAKQMYELILDLDFDEYQNGITQKAKAGISRIGE